MANSVPYGGVNSDTKYSTRLPPHGSCRRLLLITRTRVHASVDITGLVLAHSCKIEGPLHGHNGGSPCIVLFTRTSVGLHPLTYSEKAVSLPMNVPFFAEY